MSKNDLFQISVLGVISGISDKNYFGRLSAQFLALSSDAIKSYHNLSSDKDFARELPKITAFFQYVDDEIQSRDWQSSNTFLLSFVLGISVDLLNVLRNEKKRESWERLNDLASRELSKNFLNFEDEIDKADEMITFIKKYNWN